MRILILWTWSLDYMSMMLWKTVNWMIFRACLRSGQLRLVESGELGDLVTPTTSLQCNTISTSPLEILTKFFLIQDFLDLDLTLSSLV